MAINFQDRAAWKYATNAAVLIGAMLVAIQIRLKITIGGQLYPDYVPQFLSMYLLLFVAALVPFILTKPLEQRFRTLADTLAVYRFVAELSNCVPGSCVSFA